MQPTVERSLPRAMTATAFASDEAVLATAAALAQAIQASAEWREWVDAQKAAEADGRFAGMVARQKELAHIQNSAPGRDQGLDSKSLVEPITLRERTRRDELSVRLQEAWGVTIALLQRINETISQRLGLDFGNNAAARRGGCRG